ncbi:heavy-metal-associated domain-containing protein [Nitrosomonadaceae bacterium]|nr:heavy-metal-associated domain-containing protein [Nitrosomonadaceae bacterium]
MQTAILNISGMTCMGCVTSIKKVLEEIAGVSDYDISLKKEQAKIQYDPEKTNINKLKEAIVGAGFEINI